jgi:hypothetical protein
MSSFSSIIMWCFIVHCPAHNLSFEMFSTVYTFFKVLVTQIIFFTKLLVPFFHYVFFRCIMNENFCFQHDNILHANVTTASTNQLEYLCNILALKKQLYGLAAFHKQASCFRAPRDTIYRYSLYDKNLYSVPGQFSLAIRHVPEPVPSSSHSHNLFLYDPLY